RRQGLATRLLATVTEVARDTHRRVLIAGTTSTVPAGERFMRRLGAEVALEGHVNELDLSTVDHGLLRSWIERAPERASGFVLGWWLDTYPADKLEEVANMFGASNLQPRGS